MQNSKNAQTLCAKISSEILPKTIATSNKVLNSKSTFLESNNIEMLRQRNFELEKDNERLKILNDRLKKEFKLPKNTSKIIS